MYDAGSSSSLKLDSPPTCMAESPGLCLLPQSYLFPLSLLATMPFFFCSLMFPTLPAHHHCTGCSCWLGDGSPVFSRLPHSSGKSLSLTTPSNPAPLRAPPPTLWPLLCHLVFSVSAVTLPRMTLHAYVYNIHTLRPAWCLPCHCIPGCGCVCTGPMSL